MDGSITNLHDGARVTESYLASTIIDNVTVNTLLATPVFPNHGSVEHRYGFCEKSRSKYIRI